MSTVVTTKPANKAPLGTNARAKGGTQADQPGFYGCCSRVPPPDLPTTPGDRHVPEREAVQGVRAAGEGLGRDRPMSQGLQVNLGSLPACLPFTAAFTFVVFDFILDFFLSLPFALFLVSAICHDPVVSSGGVSRSPYFKPLSVDLILSVLQCT